jgi:hypothetical protein
MIKGILLSAALFSATWLNASDKDKGKDKAPPTARVADAGSFGIYMDGKRVGTETFKIEDRGEYSITSAELKIDDGETKATQTSEMQLMPNGDLRSYVWRATAPAKEEASVEPSDQLLIEHVVPADLKKTDVPHILPLSTVILDDNFFSHRELLLWRYVRTACNQQLLCGSGKFGVLIPHQHMAANAVMNLVGRDKVTVKGTVRELSKLTLQTTDPKGMVVMNGAREAEPGQWQLWVDEQFRIIKMTVTGSTIEIVRD